MRTSKVPSALILIFMGYFLVSFDASHYLPSDSTKDDRKLAHVMPSADEVTITTLPAETKSETVTTKREPRLGDGCLLVYLDVGANIGVHTRFLFEPNMYPDARHVHTNFNQHFDLHRDNQDICSFGFEPNPAHIPRHKALEQHYKNTGWRYKHIQAGASDHDGNLTFWHIGDTSHQEWGFSFVKRHGWDVPEVVPLIRLAEWIQYHITERELPEKIYGDYSEDGTSMTVKRGKVVMKLDIEGSEIYFLPDMFYSGVFCSSIDYSFGEYHPNVHHQLKQEALAGGDNVREGLQFENGKRLLQFLNTLSIQGLKSLHKENCRGYFEIFDSEAYLNDGILWPDEKGNATSTV